MKTIQINIEDDFDLLLLWNTLNNVQAATLSKHAHETFLLKDRGDKFKEWFDETVDEWNRIESIKKQIDRLIKKEKETSL